MKEKYGVKDLYQQMVAKVLSDSPQKVMTNNEADHIVRLILEYYLSTSWNDVLLNKSMDISQNTYNQILEAVWRVTQEEPVQYILKEAHFYGRKFKVSPAVLIPRRETEELVHLILQENPQMNLKILDIGTGSGCIAITLKKELPYANVHAWDISNEAIEITRHNAKEHQAMIITNVIDILNESMIDETLQFDIVVSNPPYVRRCEVSQMQNNVLKYEPSSALFVPDEHPLLFYEQIAQLCAKKNILKKAGRLYLEINEHFGQEIAKILKDTGFKDIRIVNDMQKKDRFVKGLLSI